jgi:hypothetical protein
MGPKPVPAPVLDYYEIYPDFITFREVLKRILNIAPTSDSFQTLVANGVVDLLSLLFLSRDDLLEMKLNRGTVSILNDFKRYAKSVFRASDGDIDWGILTHEAFTSYRQKVLKHQLDKSTVSDIPKVISIRKASTSPRSTADPTRKPTVISTRKTSTKPSVVKSSENSGDTLTENIQVDPTVEEPVLPSSESEIKINCNTVGTIDENPVLPLLDYDFQLPIGDIDDKDSDPSTVPTSHPTTKPTVDLMVMPTTEHMVEPTVEPTMNPTTKPTAKPTDQLTLQPSMIPDNVRVNHPGVNNSSFLNNLSFLTPEDHG